MKLGLFSLRGTCSKEPLYEITTPEFDEITIQLDPRYYKGKEFRIVTHDNKPGNVYIQKAELGPLGAGPARSGRASSGSRPRDSTCPADGRG